MDSLVIKKNFILTTVLFLFTSLSSFAGLAPDKVSVYKGTTPVLDGYLSPGEYDDASLFTGTKDWFPACAKTTDDNDLSIKVWVKHDGQNLFFAFDVTDNIVYGFDIDRWLPNGNKNAHDLTRDGWPWFGDGLELLVNASNSWNTNATVATGNGSSWQMVCSSHKSRLGGVGKGGLLEGEPRSVLTAWNNYQSWILSGAMQAVVRIKTPEEGHGYIFEWMIKPDPCLEISPGKFWSPEMGEVKMGMNIGVQDLDNKVDGTGWENIRHEDWWANYNNKQPVPPMEWGTMILVPETRNATFIEHEKEIKINAFSLNQNSPNPFNPSTAISYNLVEKARVNIMIYNISGQQLKSYDLGVQSEGYQEFVFDGSGLPSGVYLYRVDNGTMSRIGRMLLMK